MNWKSFGDDFIEVKGEKWASDAEQFSGFLFKNLVSGIGDVCKDDIGKQAFNDKIKSIVIKNEGGVKDLKATVAKGTLTISFDYLHEMGEPSGDFKRAIEALL